MPYGHSNYTDEKLKQNGVLNNLEKSDEVNACSIEVQGEVDGKKKISY